METDPPKEPGVAENQGAPGLLKREMIVLLRAKCRRLDPKFSSHSQMDTDPVSAREFEQHLFSPRLRADKSAAGELADDRAGIVSPKNPLLAVELDPLDFLSESRVPLATKKFDFRQFGHGNKVL